MLGWVRKADEFRDDWYGWLTNQCGHAMVGIIVTIFLNSVGAPWLSVPVVATIAYFVVVEWYGQRLRLLWDAIVDSFHVCMGSLIVHTIPDWKTSAMACAVWCVFLGLGVRKRIRA